MPLLSLFRSALKVPGDSPPSLTREKIQGQSGKIRLADSDDESKLDLFCYNKCDNTENQLVKNCRGVVFNGDDIVVRGFPYTEEFVTEVENSASEMGIADLKKVMSKPMSSYKYFEAHEGALLRMFYWKSKWYISTHRKLDAFRSKWASKESFGQMFKAALESLWITKDEKFMAQLASVDKCDLDVSSCGVDASSEPDQETPDVVREFQASLDKTKQYMFLVLNNYDNRIVCMAPDSPTVYHVGTVRTEMLNDVMIPSTQVELNTEENQVGIKWPTEHKFRSWDDLEKNVAKQNSEHLQGIIIYDTDSTKQYKLFNHEYQTLFKVRGNEPSVKYRYLQVRMDKKMVNQLYYLYPKYADTFDDYENTLYECAKQINKNYIDRFIKKKYVTVPKEEFVIIKACHDWHLQDREKNRISLRKVLDTLNEQNSSNLNKIIRRYKSEEMKDQLARQPKMTRLRARSYSDDPRQPSYTDRQQVNNHATHASAPDQPNSSSSSSNARVEQ